MFSSSSGRFDALPGFFSGGPGGVLPQKKSRKARSSTETAGKALRLSILAPPIYFCYLFSFKSFTVPLGGPFFRRGGVGRVCGSGSTWYDRHIRGLTIHFFTLDGRYIIDQRPAVSVFLSPVTWISRNNMRYVCMLLDLECVKKNSQYKSVKSGVFRSDYISKKTH